MPASALVRRVLFGLLVVRVAAKAPDEDHPYGHGKFETLGALAIVGFLSVTCFELVRGAVNDLASGTRRVSVSDMQLAVLVLTLGVNVVIAWYEHRRGAELGSELLVADAAHTRADVFITVGVLAGLLFARQGLWWIDPAIAIVVACIIVLVAYRILVRTIPVLVDQRAIPTRHIQETAQAVRGVKSAYAIRSSRSTTSSCSSASRSTRTPWRVRSCSRSATRRCASSRRTPQGSTCLRRCCCSSTWTASSRGAYGCPPSRAGG